MGSRGGGGGGGGGRQHLQSNRSSMGGPVYGPYKEIQLY